MADRDLPDVPQNVPDLDRISRLNRAADEQNETAEKIVYDVLQPETDAHAQTPGDDRQVGEVRSQQKEEKKSEERPPDVPDQGQERLDDNSVQIGPAARQSGEKRFR